MLVPRGSGVHRGDFYRALKGLVEAHFELEVLEHRAALAADVGQFRHEWFHTIYASRSDVGVVLDRLRLLRDVELWKDPAAVEAVINLADDPPVVDIIR